MGLALSTLSQIKEVYVMAHETSRRAEQGGVTGAPTTPAMTGATIGGRAQAGEPIRTKRVSKPNPRVTSPVWL